jgi:AcrR family transcriptional regulator
MPTQAEGTKDRIVTAAVRLFNASSVAAVTTNHIAADLEMSPGNLYYHFKNKEEIVRAAFERMNAEADALWEPPTKFDPLLLQRIVVGNLQLYAKYIFFARELASLMRADASLRSKYVDIAARRMKELVEALRPVVEAGILRNVGDEEDLHDLAESAWMIGLFCVPYAETVEPLRPRSRIARTRAALERGALLVLHLFKPYMEPIAHTALVVIVRQELEKMELE